MKIEILTKLKTERLGNRLWVLLEPFTVVVDGLQHTAPRGFVYDGNSSPRIMWSICSPVGGVYGEAGPIHDFLYSLDCDIVYPRKYSDQVHMAIGRYRGSNLVRANAVYAGIRVGGAGSYRKIRSIEKLTEKACYDYEYALIRAKELKKL